MQFINNMYQGAQSYCQDIPSNTGKQMVYAFAGAFVMEVIFTGDPKFGALAGAVSGLATAVHGLVTPLFKRFVNGQDLTFGEEVCRSFVAVIIAGSIAAACGHASILQKLSFEAIWCVLLTYMQPSRCSINSTAIIPIFPRYSL